MTIADICGNGRESLNGTTRNHQNTVSFHDGYGGETDRLSGFKRSGKPKQSMKAKEYVDKYYESLTSEDESVSLSASEDVVSIVRCKDCIHHPVMDEDCVAPPKIDGFLDYTCPYLVEDFWYCIMPADNWFCHRGERGNNN